MSDHKSPEEQRLRDRLTLRQDEHRLRDRLKSRQQERRRSNESRSSSPRNRYHRRSPPHHYRGRRDDHYNYGPPRHYDSRRDGYHYDDFGRSRRRYSPSSSRSVSSRSSRSSSSSSSRSSRSSSTSSRSSSRSPSPGHHRNSSSNELTKDQRTVFVHQLVMRATERDIRKHLKKHGIAVEAIRMVRDKQTGRHKGHAYVELRDLEDVPKAVALSNQPPAFQRFPILIKASEAEKNHVALKPLVLPGQPLNSNVQRVYVGGLDTAVTQEQLKALFEPFGSLQKVALQTSGGISKGFAFLTFGEATDAFLAISTLQGQTLLGRGIKTGWSQGTGEQSEEFPANATQKAQMAYQRLGQINLGLLPGNHRNPMAAASSEAPRAGTVAEARASLAAAATSSTRPPASTNTPQDDPKQIGNADHPSAYLHVSNMYDKDTETEPNWHVEIKAEFEDECQRFGQLVQVHVLHQQPGGQIYCQFDTTAAATACAQALAGRWFDRRQLRVAYCTAAELRSAAA